MADVWVDRKLLLGKQYVYFSRIHSESCISTVKPYFRVRQQYLVVHFDKRCHTPILREAALDQPRQAIPWLQNLPVVFQYP